ncbi:hypothetical protein BDZ89DRAFT_1013155 [Hymenopellis radicata]|nr:hypothetical protein BDZ89DRAFT_1013155 [Hymenopellis radicata]
MISRRNSSNTPARFIPSLRTPCDTSGQRLFLSRYTMPPSRTLELVWTLPNSTTPSHISSIDHSAADSTCSTQRHARKKAASHIPRPPNAFILFRSSFIKSQHVSTDVETNHSTLSKIIGMTWQGLSDAERQVWHDKARAALDEHRRRFPAYAFRPSHQKPVPSGGGGGGTRKKRVREVEPKDTKRCAKIAELLVKGFKGAELDDAIREFDKTHVPEIITRFDTPITESAFRKVTKEKKVEPATTKPEPPVERELLPLPPPLEEAFVEQQMYYPAARLQPSSPVDPALSSQFFPSEYLINSSPHAPTASMYPPPAPSFSRRSFSGFPSDSACYQETLSPGFDFFAFPSAVGDSDYLADLMNFEMPMPLVPTWDASAPVMGF